MALYAFSIRINSKAFTLIYFSIFTSFPYSGLMGLMVVLLKNNAMSLPKFRLQGHKLPTFSFAKPSIASANELIPIRAVELLPRRAHCCFSMWIA